MVVSERLTQVDDRLRDRVFGGNHLRVRLEIALRDDHVHELFGDVHVRSLERARLDDERETIGAALMYLGYPINDTDPAHLEEAKNLLIAQSECVKAYDSQTNDDLIIQGETLIGHIWTGDAILAGLPEYGGREGIVYVIPREGCTIWQDNMMIPEGAPNSYTSHIFMNYLADAQRAAQNAEFVGYGTPNEAAKVFIDPEILADPAVYPPAEVFAQLQWIEDVGDALGLYDRVWTEFKAAAGG